MKPIIYILLVSLLSCIIKLNAQSAIQIDTVSYKYHNGLTGQTQIIYNYQIKNNSNEEYLTWVSLDPAKNESAGRLMNDFFIKIKGDYNFIGIMNEDLLSDKSICDVGYTFIKNIQPNESFSYIILKYDSKSTYYKDRIVIITKKEVEQYLHMQIKQKYFFPLKSIILTGY